MITGKGINTVEIDGEVKHITDLDPATLSSEWAKRQRELGELYRINAEANKGWRGVLLGLIGVHLPDKCTIYIGGVDSKKQPLYSIGKIL